MNSNCPSFDCDCSDNPLNGYSSEAVDVIAPLATAFVSIPPPLGVAWCKYECMAFASDVAPPRGAGIAPGAPQFGNAPQSCSVTCPDGSIFPFEVNAGSFSANTQDAANAAALAFACSQAANRAICLSALSNAQFTVGQPFSATITATGNSLATGSQTNSWQLISGSLPSGLTFNGGNLASDQVTITGTPTQGGTFTFGVSCTDPLGDTVDKFYTLNCAIGFTITNNLFTNFLTGGTAVGFGLSGPADPGYDTQYSSIQNACGIISGNETSGENNNLSLAFTSATLQTWNLKIVMTFSGPGFLTDHILTINGVTQSGWVLSGNTFTWTGTFQTNNCANTLVSITGAGNAEENPNQVGCVGTMIEWATP